MVVERGNRAKVLRGWKVVCVGDTRIENETPFVIEKTTQFCNKNEFKKKIKS